MKDGLITCIFQQGGGVGVAGFGLSSRWGLCIEAFCGMDDIKEGFGGNGVG